MYSGVYISMTLVEGFFFSLPSSVVYVNEMGSISSFILHVSQKTSWRLKKHLC